MKKLVIASNNPGKLREFQRMLAPLGIEVLTQAQLGIKEAEEPHCTFVENALAKARHVSAASGLPALADDSGICVAALGGAPGVQSARYAGDDPKSDTRNNEKLLYAMQGAADRRAHYYCVLVLVHRADDPQPVIAEGEWHGEIGFEERGSGGFGYDPLFRLPDFGKTAAELSHDEKAQVSHRAKALKVLLDKLRLGDA
jgi:XTP/dITP diphosphohydrolase